MARKFLAALAFATAATVSSGALAAGTLIDNFSSGLGAWTKTGGVSAGGSGDYAQFELQSSDVSLSKIIGNLTEGATYLIEFDIALLDLTTSHNWNSMGTFNVSVLDHDNGDASLATKTFSPGQTYDSGNPATLQWPTGNGANAVVTWVTAGLKFVVPANADADLLGSIKLVFSGFSTNNGNLKIGIDNVTISEVRSNPVPGPIAGAGLPVLLGGAAFIAARRRKAKA